jgi:hypothetical protein
MASEAVRAQNAPSDASSGAAAAIKQIDDRNAFVVQQVERETVLVNGGKNAGLVEGMTLVIKRSSRYYTASGGEFHGSVIVALLEVKSVSNTSAMCEIHARNQEIRRGDIAWLSPAAAKPERKQPLVSAQPSEPLINQANAQTSGKGFWTTPDQKPPEGVSQLPELSLAERARLARTMGTPNQTAQQQSTNEVIPPPPPVRTTNAANSTVVPASASATPAGPGGFPTVFPTVSGTPTATNGRANGAGSVPTVAERARLARAERAAGNQGSQGVSSASQPATGGPPPATTTTNPVAANTEAKASAPAVSGNAALQTSTIASSAPPKVAAFPSSTVAAAIKPESIAAPAAQPSMPVVSSTATAIQPKATAGVSNVAAAPVTAAAAVKTGTDATTTITSSTPLKATAPASSTVAAAIKPEASPASAAQPSMPVVSSTATAIQPKATAGVSNVAAAPVAAVAAVKAGTPATTPAVPGAGTAQAAPLSTVAPSMSISKANEAGPGISSLVAATANAPSTPSVLRTTFRVKYVAADALYIEGGKDAGLVEGMTLAVERLNDPSTPPSGPRTSAGESIAEVAIVSVSNTSAVCEIRTKSTDIQRGDLAVLSQTDQSKLEQANTLGPTRKYPLVIAFSEGDPLDEEQREVIPKPPLPEINRARGRIGLDYTFINNTGTSSGNTAQVGGVVRIDMSRIGGTYWNLNGYWRGRLNAFSSSTQTQSVYDLMNRTYTLGFSYVNPGSQWTAGVGRLYLPWATSLDTLDGGYVGRRFGKHTIIGAFAGTDPDPTSFNYNPDLRTAGTFVAFEAGSFERLRFTSTEGIAVSGIGWSENRQFVFNETGLFYKRYLSIYNATQVDKEHLPTGGLTEGLSRSFSTLRVQPFSLLSFDVNHSYFRDVPTFSAALISTGLLDKYLFQGLSVGSRVELPGRISLYGSFGQSNRSGDTHSSLNQLYGVTLGRLWFTGIRADVRYSKFASSFGSGNYRALSLSRSFKDALRLEVNAGKQSFVSSLAVPTDYRLLGSTMDLNLGSHYFFEAVFNAQRGLQQSYNQWILTTGYRFDTKRGKQ